MLSLEGTLVPPESEIDAQPVSQERRGSTTGVPSGRHMKFDEEPIPEIVETTEQKVESIPTYEDSDATGDSSDSDESSD